MKKHVELLKDYVEIIKNKDLQKFANLMIEATPDMFFSLPSSTSGLFHPKDELQEGGKLIHCKKAAMLSQQAARRYKLDNYSTDVLFTICLIHDMPCCFYFDKEQNRIRIDPDHAMKNSRKAYDLILDNNLYFDDIININMSPGMVEIREKALNIIISSIFYHMGIWTDYYKDKVFDEYCQRYKNHPIVVATQECDFYSSRRMIGVDYKINQ